MTGNRTTELLRKLLSKRGVESRETMSGNVGWTDANGEDVVTLRSDDASGLVLLKAWLTPEQGIAVTLGNEMEKRLEKLVRIYGEIANYFCDRFACCDAEFANCKYCIGLPQDGQCKLGWCNYESMALGIEQPVYGGGECEPANLQELYDRIGELEELVQDWQALYEEPDYGDCIRLRKRMQELGIEVIDE